MDPLVLNGDLEVITTHGLLGTIIRNEDRTLLIINNTNLHLMVTILRNSRLLEEAISVGTKGHLSQQCRLHRHRVVTIITVGLTIMSRAHNSTTLMAHRSTPWAHHLPTIMDSNKVKTIVNKLNIPKMPPQHKPTGMDTLKQNTKTRPHNSFHTVGPSHQPTHKAQLNKGMVHRSNTVSRRPMG